MSEQKLTLKQMCDEFGVTPRTLRYYEYIELISPARQGRTRLYGASEKARLKLILSGKRWGFSLEEVRQWLNLYQSNNLNIAQTEASVENSARQLKILQLRKIELQEVIDELQNFHQESKNKLKALKEND